MAAFPTKGKVSKSSRNIFFPDAENLVAVWSNRWEKAFKMLRVWQQRNLDANLARYAAQDAQIVLDILLKLLASFTPTTTWTNWAGCCTWSAFSPKGSEYIWKYAIYSSDWFGNYKYNVFRYPAANEHAFRIYLYIFKSGFTSSCD